MALREVRNKKTGDIAMFDDETGNVMPTQPKNAAEAPVVSATQLRQVRNKKTGALGLFDPDTGSVFPQQEATQQVQDLGAQHGATLANMQQPPPEARVAEVQQSLKPPPRPMGGVSDIDITGGKASLVPPAAGGSYGIAPAILTPAARIPAAIGGAVTSAAEDIGQGKFPSVGGMAMGGLGGFVSPEIAKGAQSLYRGAAGIFGRGPMKKAASGIYDETKAITRPMTTPETDLAMLDQIDAMGRTLPAEAKKAVTDIFDKFVGSRVSGKPLSYGEVFKNATALNEQVHKLYASGATKVAEPLDAIQKKMMTDLAASGPEAQAAVDAYHRAVGMFGGMSGVMRVMKNLTGLSAGGAGLVAAALKPSTMMVSGPAALLAGIANLSTRVPGVGPHVAQALITEPGKISLGAGRALADAINDAVKEKEWY